MTTTDNTENNENTRPDFLKILCILTFIGSGLSLVSNLLMFMTIDIVREYYQNGMFDFLEENMDLNVLDVLVSINSTYFILQALVFSLAIYGTYTMWNLKKLGFHIYVIAQIILLILPQVFLPGLPFPTFELIISTIFVLLYAKNLQFMS